MFQLPGVISGSWSSQSLSRRHEALAVLSSLQRRLFHELSFRSQLHCWLLAVVLPDRSMLVGFLLSVPALLPHCISFVQFTALRNYKYIYLFTIWICSQTTKSMKAWGYGYLNKPCRARPLAGPGSCGPLIRHSVKWTVCWLMTIWHHISCQSGIAKG